MILPGLHSGHSRREPVYRANAGAPMSRTRRQRLASSLLGRDDGAIRCPLRIRLGLKFEDTYPVQCLEALLEAEGLQDPEELRERFVLPAGRLICRPVTGNGWRLPVVRANRHRVLEQALWLGLCTAQLFDPDRPVLWTEASLTRAVELFDPRGFYA